MPDPVKQQTRAVVPAGSGSNGRGRPQGERGGNQRIRGNGNAGGVLANIEVRLTFIEEIKAKQFEDESLNELRNKTVSGKAQDASLDAGGV
uniref:'chromo' domain containing protein n=1 Tax=Solanum tuberosum TaxID=4113 RepID=M1DBT3_SOLTU